MTITQNKNEAQLTMAIEGRLDTTTAPQLEAAIAQSLDGVNDLVFDCSALEYISSAGLRVLMKTQKQMAAPKTLKLTGVNEIIMEIFEITGFNNILTIE